MLELVGPRVEIAGGHLGEHDLEALRVVEGVVGKQLGDTRSARGNKKGTYDYAMLVRARVHFKSM